MGECEWYMEKRDSMGECKWHMEAIYGGMGERQWNLEEKFQLKRIDISILLRFS